MVATVESNGPGGGALATTLGRSQIIDRILGFNPSASVEFLMGFDDRALALYLEHLHAKLELDDPRRPWRRPGDTAAIRWCEARDAD
jgi:hypothetical protein